MFAFNRTCTYVYNTHIPMYVHANTCTQNMYTYICTYIYYTCLLYIR